MFDKIQFLQCSENDLKELFNKKLNGECTQVILGNKDINVVVHYNNHNDFFNDANILKLNSNRSYLNDNKDNNFHIKYSLDEIKSFLKEESNNRLTDNCDFWLNDTNDVVMFKMINYKPIPFF